MITIVARSEPLIQTSHREQVLKAAANFALWQLVTQIPVPQDSCEAVCLFEAKPWGKITAEVNSVANPHIEQLHEKTPTQMTQILPGSVSKSEASLQSDAAVHHQPPEEQRGIAGWTARRVPRRHFGRAVGRASLRFQIEIRRPLRSLLLRALWEHIAHDGRVPVSSQPSAKWVDVAWVGRPHCCINTLTTELRVYISHPSVDMRNPAPLQRSQRSQTSQQWNISPREFSLFT